MGPYIYRLSFLVAGTQGTNIWVRLAVDMPVLFSILTQKFKGTKDFASLSPPSPLSKAWVCSPHEYALQIYSISKIYRCASSSSSSWDKL